MNSLNIVVFDKDGRDVTKDKKWFVDVYGDLYFIESEYFFHSPPYILIYEQMIWFCSFFYCIKIKGNISLINHYCLIFNNERGILYAENFVGTFQKAY